MGFKEADDDADDVNDDAHDADDTATQGRGILEVKWAKLMFPADSVYVANAPTFNSLTSTFESLLFQLSVSQRQSRFTLREESSLLIQ